MPVFDPDGFVRGLAMITFGMAVTWGLTTLAGRLLTRKKTARWIAGRLGAIGWSMLAGGLGLAGYALSQGPSAINSSLVLLGSLVAMAGLWLITVGP